MTRSEMARRWPLYTIEEDSNGFFKLKDSEKSYSLYHEDKKPITEKEIERIDNSHRKQTIALNLAPKYPFLYISQYGVWIKVQGHDREALIIKNIEKLDKNDLDLLEELNQKVACVSEDPDNYFFCGQCEEVCVMKETQEKGLHKLLDEKIKYYKFHSAGAAIFCNQCVESPGFAKNEYEAFKKLGNRYYD